LRIDLMLALRHQPELENFIQELYDPTSSSYRHFVTVEEFTERFGPSQEDYDALIRFAQSNGFKLNGTSSNRMTLSATASVGNIERAFHITMGLYQHPTENRTFYSPDREPVADLPFALWHISGLDNFSIPRPALVHRDAKDAVKPGPEATTGSCPSASFCGSDMRAAYYGETALTGTGQSVGLFEYAGTDLVDLTTYYKNAKQTNNVPVTLVSADGTSVNCVASQGCDDTEQTLDMTQALGMAPGMSSLVMYVGSTDSAIFNKMATANPLNAQLSSSWYWSPADPKTLDPIFQEFASQGQNLFDAAGDHGRWGPSIWPADDAYLVSVGGTDLTTKSAGGPWNTETAWSDGGGGISPNKIPIPSWQVTTADGCSTCSTTYRNAPDVSANSNFTFYVCADQTTCTANEYGGTSFAAPMWAGYLALVNQQAVANGSPTLGFIDPAIYTIGLGANYDADFHDITSGSNGYAATVGYDLATGWGSPNAGLIAALAGPAGPSFTLTASPSSVSIAEGSSGTSTITVVPSDGFSGSVTLGASGLPNGVSAQFNPNPTSTTSTLTLTVGSGAATGSSTITITGTSGSVTASTTLSLTVTPNGPVVSFSPTSLTFPKRTVGTTSTAHKVVLTNTGISTLNLTSIAISGDFALATVKQTKKVIPCASGGTVAAGASCTFAVTFTPTQTGARIGDVTFTDNAPGSPQQFPLSGTGK
jgi:kumamolisin